MSKMPLLFPLLNLSHFVCLIFWEARSELLPEISVSSIYASVFLSGLSDWMTNDTEGLTSHCLKLWERYDLSLLLTCVIFHHTYSNTWLNPSLFPCLFFLQCAFAFLLFWSIFRDKDLLFIPRSHLDCKPLVWGGMGMNLIWQCTRLKAAWGLSSRNGCAQICTYICMHRGESTLQLTAGTLQAAHRTNSEFTQTKAYSLV